MTIRNKKRNEESANANAETADLRMAMLIAGSEISAAEAAL